MASRRRELATDDDPWRVSAFVSALMQLLLSVLLLLGAVIAFITSQLVKYFGLDPPCTYIGCSHPHLPRSSKRRRYSVHRHHHPKVDHLTELFPDYRNSWVYSKLQLQSEEFSSSNDDTDGSLLSDKNDSSSRHSICYSSDLDVRHVHLDEDRNVSYDHQNSWSPIFKKPSLPKYVKPKASNFYGDGKRSAKEECIPLFSTRSVSACGSDFNANEDCEVSSLSSDDFKKPSSQKKLQRETLTDGDASISRGNKHEHHYILLEDEEPSQREYMKPNAAIFGGDGTQSTEEDLIPLYSTRSISARGSDSDAEDEEPSQREYMKPNAAIFGGDGPQQPAEDELIPLYSTRSVSAHGSDSDAEDDCQMSSTSTKKLSSQKENLKRGTLIDVDSTISRESEHDSHYMLLEDEEPSRRKYVKPNSVIFDGDVTQSATEECVPLFSKSSVSAHGSDSDVEDDCEMSSTSTDDFKKPNFQKEKLEEGTLVEGNASISRDTEHEHHYMLLKDEDEVFFEAPFFDSIEGLSRDFEDHHHDMLLKGEDEEKAKTPFSSNLQAESVQSLLECISDSGLEVPKISAMPDLGNKVADMVVVPDSEGQSDFEQAAENCAQGEWIKDITETTCTSALNLSSRLGEGQNTRPLLIPSKVPAIRESSVEDERFIVGDKGQINSSFLADEPNMEFIQGFENVNAGNSEGIMVEDQVGEDGALIGEKHKEPLEGPLNVHVLEKDIDAQGSLFPMELESMVPKDLVEDDEVQEIQAFESGSESGLEDQLLQVQEHVEECESVPINPFTAGSDACDTENIPHGEDASEEVSIASYMQGTHEHVFSNRGIEERCSILDSCVHDTESKSDEETILKASLEEVIQEAMDQYLISFKGRLSEDRVAKCVSSLENIDVQQVSVGQVEVTKERSLEEFEKPCHHAASQMDEQSSKCEGELVLKDSCKGNAAINGSFTEGLKINQSFDIREAERGIQKHEISSEQMVSQSQVMKAEKVKEENHLEEDQEEGLDALREALRAERIALTALETELENERNAAAIATSEAMAMISRLQEEKSAMQMEVVQLQRMSEEKADYDEQAMELLKEILLKREKEKHVLEKEVELYRERLLAEKIDMLKKSAAEKSNKDALPALTPVLLLRGTDEDHDSLSPEGKNDRLKALPSLEAFYDAGITSSPHITRMAQNMACREHFRLSPQPAELKDPKGSIVDQGGLFFQEDKGNLAEPFIKGLNGLHNIHQEPRGTSRSIFSTNDEETQFILERLWVLEEELRELRGEDVLGTSLEAQHMDGSPVKRKSDCSCTDLCGVRCIDGEIGEHKDEDGPGMFLPIHDVYEVQSTPNHCIQGVQQSDPLEYSKNMLKDFESFPRDISQEYMTASRHSHRPQNIVRTLFPSKETHSDSALALDYPCADDSHKQCLKVTEGRLVAMDVSQQLAVRLQVLETDRGILREILESFRHRDTELKLLQEIAQYLRELQTVGSGGNSAGGVLEDPFLPTLIQSCGSALKKRRYCSGPGQTQTLLLQQKSI